MITDGTKITYDGKAWSPWYEKNVSIEGKFVALDGIDTNERGSCLPVVPEAAYRRGAWFGGDEYFICDGYLEFVRVEEDN
jgi:hypothetical protein